ncbi:MAG TPA: 23S rRNA (adenine(2503)-C(2))-methyltransferase RlmN [Lachnospiraceae bacterium]|nr:23S rRNA (adenine(2503)-C(2))-methyltransferase RlmN [Lachnospiraceae bacterium]
MENNEGRADLRSLQYEELKEVLTGMGHKGYRADQIFDWIHRKKVSDPGEMKNIPSSLKEELFKRYEIFPVKKELVRVSRLDETRKYLFRLWDGNLIESVFMKYAHGNSVCVSTQAGCRMGCRFCASAIDGLIRDLTAGEMLGQVYGIEKDTGERVSNVVMMGTGEPLDNYENSVSFIRLLNDERGANISQRSITLSTCGLAERIIRLRDEDLAITLAVSLHAPNDRKRSLIMPVAKRYTVNEVIAACRDYYDGTNRRLTFEYSLIEGLNDSEEDARELSELLAGLNAHVNLICINPVREKSFREPTVQAVRAFQNKLEKNHINVTIRRELGRDIEGACGQLRRSRIRETGDSLRSGKE